MRLGTAADNARDRMEHGNQTRGSTTGNSVLTETQVVDMRRRRAAGEAMTSIAKDYGIHLGTAYGIVTRRSWRHVP